MQYVLKRAEIQWENHVYSLSQTIVGMRSFKNEDILVFLLTRFFKNKIELIICQHSKTLCQMNENKE